MENAELKRFMGNVDIVPGGCWLWTRPLNSGGYGSFYPSGTPRKSVGAHRWAYERFVGPIPEGMDIDHVKARGCTNRHCVNPAHLEPVTRSENLRRGAGRGKPTHCKRGHPLEGDNVYQIPGGGRACRRCRYETNREIRERVVQDPEKLAAIRAADAAAARARRTEQRGGAPAKPNGEKTHCAQGHPYAGDNLMLAPNGARRCRECARQANARAYAKRRAATK
jgi:hypothetical protein